MTRRSQADVHSCMLEHQAKHGRPPSMRQIAAALSISKTAVVWHVARLAESGLVEMRKPTGGIWGYKPGQAVWFAIGEVARQEEHKPTPEQWAVVQQHLKLIYAAVKPFASRKTYQGCDAGQDGAIAVAKALPRYDPKVGPLDSFIAEVARGPARNAVRAIAKAPRSLDELKDGGEPAFASQAEIEAVRREEARALRAAIARLDGREREVMTLRLNGRTQSEAAKEIGTYQPAVVKIERRAHAKLREMLADYA